jgi:hypothetical protein
LLKANVVSAKWKLNTALQYEMFSKMDHRFIPNPAGMEVKVKLDNCRKIAGEEMSVPVHKL